MRLSTGLARLSAAIALACPVLPLRAQAARYLISGGGSYVRLQSTAPSITDQLSGVLASARGRMSAWRFEVEVGYAEGTLRPRSGNPAARDLVEGYAVLGIRPVPWISLSGGPHARGYLQGGITERWLLWEGRARVDTFIAGPAIRGYLEIRQTMSGTIINGASPFGSSRGGEAGMTIHFSRTPIWLCLAYGIERSRLASGVGLDAMETLNAAIGLGAGR